MNKSILITDDEPAFREALYLFLSEEGFDCHLAKNGQEAVEKVQQTSFHIILLDLRMPRQNGIDTLKKIRKISPSSIVYILTAYYDIEEAVAALKQGAQKILLKPIDFDELLKELVK